MENSKTPAEVCDLSRRRAMGLMGGLVALPLFGCGGSGGGSSFTVQTSSGTAQGELTGNSIVYRGLRYARPPVGALRFKSPQPYFPSTSEVAANTFGPASIQTLPPYVTWIYTVPAVQSEDCLTLNVWRPVDMGAKVPVIVFLHGGAWRTGATSMPLMDGRQLAEKGFVVVTVNFRVGALGFLSHPDFVDPETGTSANWQLQDQAAALAWVKNNVALFGGDPANICLVGQSAGATNAALIAQHPEWSKLVQKVILISPAGISAPGAFTATDAARYTELLASTLSTTPKGLYNVKAEDLHQAELALNQRPLPPSFASGFAVKAAPVQDGKTIISDWTRTSWPAAVPVMITNTLTEGSFFVDLYDQNTGQQLTPPLPQTTADLTSRVAAVAGSTAGASAVIEAYMNSAATDGRSTAPGDIWVEIYGDAVLRNYSARYAARLAAQGNNVRYGTFMHAVQAPGHGVPHCTDLPFLFGTYRLDYYRTKVGAGAIEDAISQHVMSAATSFAANGNAVFADGSAWPRFPVDGSMSALIAPAATANLSLGPIPKKAQLAVWDGIYRY